MKDWLSYQAIISPQKTALLWQDTKWTYARLDSAVTTMVAELAAMHVKKGAHVAVLMPNRPEYVIAIHALARMGAVLVPLNIRLTEDELRWQADHADCTVIICSKETETQVLPLLPRQTIPGSVPSAADDTTAPSTKGYFYERRLLLSVDRPSKPAIKPLQLVQQKTPEHPQPDLNLEALQSIVFTSGTTGYPKGAMLTFGNHFWSATASAYRLGTLSNDRWLLCMPLYHVGGMSIVFRCCLYGTSILLLDKFDAQGVFKALQERQVTLASFVPTMLKRLLEEQREPIPSSLRAVLLGGAAATQELLESARQKQWPVAVTYGLTEACSQVATSVFDDANAQKGWAGKPLMFTDVRIANDEQVGEIIVRGPTVMQGYYRDQEATYAALHDGWLRTGDLGYFDENGDLCVLDRRTDLIVSGGENVYPSEVERVLLAHPGVVDACVVGIPNEEWGQLVVAAIVSDEPSLDARDIISFCRSRLAGYKTPRQVLFLQDLPQTASGKIKREDVRKLLLELPKKTGSNFG